MVLGDRSQGDARPRPRGSRPSGSRVAGGEDPQRRGQFLEDSAPLPEGKRSQVASLVGQQVEEGEVGRRLLGQASDAARRGMDAILQGVEIETAVDDDDHLAVRDRACG